MATTKLMTADELLEWTGPERYELLRGVRLEMAPTNFEHGYIASRIDRILGSFVDEHELGAVTTAESGFRLQRDPDTVFAPDVAFIRADRLPPLSEWREFLALAPDLVVEVLSPSDRPGQVAAKINTYLALGVSSVWLVDPDERSVTVHTSQQVPRVFAATDVLDGEDLLPGFQVHVAKLFP